MCSTACERVYGDFVCRVAHVNLGLLQLGSYSWQDLGRQNDVRTPIGARTSPKIYKLVGVISAGVYKNTKYQRPFCCGLLIKLPFDLEMQVAW